MGVAVGMAVGVFRLVTLVRIRMAARAKFMSALSSVSAAVFEYDTPKIVHIKNKKVGILNRMVQLGIVLYIIVYVTLQDL